VIFIFYFLWQPPPSLPCASTALNFTILYIFLSKAMHEFVLARLISLK
jgi:hypothetical protein